MIFVRGHFERMNVASALMWLRNNLFRSFERHREHSPSWYTSSQPMWMWVKREWWLSNESLGLIVSLWVDSLGERYFACTSMICVIIVWRKLCDSFKLGHSDCGRAGTSLKCSYSWSFRTNSMWPNVWMSGITDNPFAGGGKGKRNGVFEYTFWTKRNNFCWKLREN